jgi:hypothetical protein
MIPRAMLIVPNLGTLEALPARDILHREAKSGFISGLVALFRLSLSLHSILRRVRRSRSTGDSQRVERVVKASHDSDDAHGILSRCLDLPWFNGHLLHEIAVREK